MAAVLLAVDRLERHAEAVAALRQPLDDQLVEQRVEPVGRVPPFRVAVHVAEGARVLLVGDRVGPAVPHAPPLLRFGEERLVHARRNGPGDRVDVVETAGVEQAGRVVPEAPRVRHVERVGKISEVIVIVRPVAVPDVEAESDRPARTVGHDAGRAEVEGLVDVVDVVTVRIAARRDALGVDDVAVVLERGVHVEVVLAPQPALGLLGVHAAQRDVERHAHVRLRDAAEPDDAAVLKGVVAARGARHVGFIRGRETKIA